MTSGSQPFPLADREALGYTEHAGSISVARSMQAIPDIDWDRAIEHERSHIDMLLPMNDLAIEFGLQCFAIAGRLPQHTDCVSYSELTSGMILDCGPDLELNAGGRRIEVRTGDQFLLNPHVRHGAETVHRLVFVAMDESRHSLPDAAECRSLFIEKLSRVALRYPARPARNDDRQTEGHAV